MRIIGRRQIQQESAAQYILEHLFNTGSVTHKELILIFGNKRNKQAVWRVLRELEINRLVEIRKGINTDIRKAVLTEKGLSMLQALDDYYNVNEFLRVPHWSIKDIKSEKETQIKTMMVGADILCHPRHKPDLLNAAKIINTGEIQEHTEMFAGYWFPETIDSFAERFGNGIYYSPAEVREALKINIGAEQTYTSRFNGIIITPDKLYVIYHVQNGLIKINTPSEITLLDSLHALFFDYPRYNSYSCITFGTAPVDVAIPTLVTGFKGGSIVNKKSLYNINAQEAMGFFKANNKLFGEIFYIPISDIGIGLLERIVFTTKEEREENIKEWFETMSGYISQSETNTGIFKNNGCIVEHIAYTELKKILEIRKGSTKVRIVTLPILAEGISQAVGPKAIDFVDMEGKEIKTKKYDIYGFENGTVLTIQNKKTEKKEPTSYSVHCRVSRSIYNILKNESEKEDISVPQKINQIIESYYKL